MTSPARAPFARDHLDVAVHVAVVAAPVGVAVGSQLNLLMATEEIMKSANYEKRRVIPVHERRLGDDFPSRKIEAGLAVVEVCLGGRENSRVS